MNSLSINYITNLYKQNIINKINMMKDKVVVFDFDGTLTEFKYADKTLLPCTEAGLHEYSKTGNIYENVHILETMRYIISQLNSNDVYILTYR